MEKEQGGLVEPKLHSRFMFVPAGSWMALKDLLGFQGYHAKGVTNEGLSAGDLELQQPRLTAQN